MLIVDSGQVLLPEQLRVAASLDHDLGHESFSLSSQ